ncbi:hypothetical protein B6N60_04247 [Richelia sinica FACHB-800]|uniref:Uncharacterized protein n=1 Tax=Richelia sinica FACHB-800 TaxID=1357546 RepID=A0A975TCH4_9NOST|nr:hypothetical protein B6N60_04247 [Richelia sinica FACHB-800]
MKTSLLFSITINNCYVVITALTIHLFSSDTGAILVF